MKRKNFTYKLSNGKEYKFSERNREDTDFSHLHERLRKQRMILIQETVENNDNQLALLMSEMNRVYSQQEISVYLAGNMDELLTICYNSFKIENPEINFDEFKKLVPETSIKNLTSLIQQLEEPDEVKKKVNLEKAKKSLKK